MPVQIIFFDIGGTLGERDQATGKLVPFPSTLRLLVTIRDNMKLRMGIITTLGDLTNVEGRALLAQAGLAEFFDPVGFVSEHDVHGEWKPKAAIYRFAAASPAAPGATTHPPPSLECPFLAAIV